MNIEHIVSDDDTAILVVGPAENDPKKIVFRIDDAKTSELLAYVRLDQERAKAVAYHILDFLITAAGGKK